MFSPHVMQALSIARRQEFEERAQRARKAARLPRGERPRHRRASR